MKTKRFFLSLYAILLLLAAFPTQAFALGHGSYHPPCLTILVTHAPRDMTATVEMEYNDERFPVTLEKQTKLWEMQFRLYREGSFRKTAWFGNNKDFRDAVLILQSGGEETRIPLPAQQLSTGNEDVLCYNVKTGAFRVGMSPWRLPLLFALRMTVILGLKLLVLWLYGYRHWSSFLAVLGVNALTMGLVNWVVRNWLNVDAVNTYPLFVVGMVAVLLVELLALVVFINERDRNRTVAYGTVANLTGLTALLVMLGYFPV